MADEYFLWDNRAQKFWKPNSNGYTYCTHLAGRYSAEDAVNMVNYSWNVGHMMIVRAPTVDEMARSLAVGRAAGPGRKPGAHADLDPAFLIWNNKSGCVLTDGGLSRLLHRGRRFTVEEATARLKRNEDLDSPQYIPLRAPPPGAALAEFLDAVPEARD